MDMAIFWMIVFLVMLIGELATTALVSIWFCGGAILALISHYFGASPIIQIFIFVLSSFILLILTRPFSKKMLAKHDFKTNVEGLIGKKATVTEVIDNVHAEGTVFIDGKLWTARSVNDIIIQPDTEVTIVEIKGVKVIVK